MDIVEQLRWLGDHASYEPHMHHTAADEIERLREALRGLVIAVEYNGPPIDFGGGNLCWEARIPIGFIDDARAALEGKE